MPDFELSGRLRLDTSALDQLSGRLTRSLGTVGAAVAGAFAVDRVLDFGKAGLKAAADYEQTTIAFAGLFGSADKAQAKLKELRDFAARTPFELPQVTQAAQKLIGVGFAADQVIPTLETLGNTAAQLGVRADGINLVIRALGQMKGKGKVMAEEINQIAENLPGFNAYAAIAAKRGTTVAKVMEDMKKGAVSADEGVAAILEGMRKFPGAAGAMARQSMTLNGLMSTLKDTVRNTSIDFITPFLPQMEKNMSKLIGFLSDEMPKAGQKAFAATQDIGQVFGSALPIALDVSREAFSRIGSIVDGVAGAFDAFASNPAVVKFLSESRLAAGRLFDGLSEGTKGLPADASAFEEFGANVRDVVDRIGNKAQEMGRAFSAKLDLKDAKAKFEGFAKDAVFDATGFIATVNTAMKTGDWTEVGKSMGEAVGKVLSGAGDLAARLGSAIQEAVGKVDWVNLAYEFGKQAPTLVLGFTTGLLNFDIGSIFSFVADHWAEVLIGVVTTAFAPLRIIRPFAEILGKIPLAGPFIEWAVLHFKTVSDDLFGRAVSAMQRLGQGILEGLGLHMPGALKGVVGKLDDLVVAIYVKADDVFIAGRNLIGRVPEAILSGIESTGRAIGRFLDEMMKHLTGFSTREIFDAGARVIQSFIDGLTSMFAKVRSKLKELTDSLPDWKGPRSRDRALLFGAGVNVMTGFMRGIDSQVPDLRSQLTGITNLVGGLTVRDISDIGRLRFGSDAAIASRMASSGASGDVTVNVEFNGVDRDQARGFLPELTAAIQAGVGSR